MNFILSLSTFIKEIVFGNRAHEEPGLQLTLQLQPAFTADTVTFALKQLWGLKATNFPLSHFPLELLQYIFKTAT